jgi:mRNA interferase MazF
MTRRPATTNPTRGEIWSVQFDPQVGQEIGKVRPALVISSNSVGRLPLRIVVPITDWKQHYAGFPWFVHLAPTSTNGLTKESGADAFQVKSVAIARFKTRRGRVPTKILDEVAAAVALCVGYQP